MLPYCESSIYILIYPVVASSLEDPLSALWPSRSSGEVGRETWHDEEKAHYHGGTWAQAFDKSRTVAKVVVGSTDWIQIKSNSDKPAQESYLSAIESNEPKALWSKCTQELGIFGYWRYYRSTLVHAVLEVATKQLLVGCAVH